MRHLFPLFILLSCLLTFLPGCEPKEDMMQTTGRLEFATDSVVFDTVFTTIKTVTKRFWVYNRNSGAVKTDVSLRGVSGNTYALIINGDAGPAITGVTIRGNDSLLVLVRATLGDNGTAAKPFLVTDEVHFLTNGNDQDVKLVAYGQNAYFHNGQILPCNSVWRNDKPHVIFNSVQIDSGCMLRIMPGTKVYSHAGSAIIVMGTLIVNSPTDYQPGTTNIDTVKANNRNIVRFQGDRLESFYNDVPGQWGGIIFTSTSRNNSIRYAEIKNSTFGAFLYNPDEDRPHPTLSLENTVIKNISGSQVSFSNANASTGGGVISYSGDVTATNCLFTNCGEYAMIGLGGVYSLNFCTIANYTPSFQRENSSLTFTNTDDTKPTVKLPTSVSIRNSVVWGSYEDELFFQNNGSASFPTPIVRNSLLRTKEYMAITDAAGKPGLAAPALKNLVNVPDPLFVRTTFSGGNADYRFQATSPAVTPVRPYDGVLPSPTPPSRDLLNLPRDLSKPTIGAYEFR
ncbi:hypothetical protein [Hymenobacter negativus]|uniref:Right-handed parallel beta-helix repeat-containing protein n=1 Tax=Hymenobacter negativus TaxID=2795026 RepID=A0ABS3QD83_9BACT|nr:hypothetical protein [Hymenobacter negativus]MBO2008680.1 hypothetical protein [Hymenobacter negativus]